MIKRISLRVDVALIEKIRNWEKMRERKGLGTISFRRWTKAIANYFDIHTDEEEKIINAEIKDDRMKNGYG